MTIIAQKRSPSFAREGKVAAKAVPCKNCKLKTFNPSWICVLCELFGPVRSKKMQRANSE